MARSQRPFPDSVGRFKKHMPKGKDVTMIVLKTHLLIEAEMNELLELTLRRPEYVYRSRFSFDKSSRAAAEKSKPSEENYSLTDLRQASAFLSAALDTLRMSLQA